MFGRSDTVDVAVIEPRGSDGTHLPVGLGLAAERRDADVSMREGGEAVGVERADVSENVEQQLRELGYSDAG